MNAAVEVALEKFMGDKVFGGESILGRKMSKFIGKTVSSPVARGVIGYIADSVGEGAEEVIATAISPYIQKIAGVEVDSPEFDDYVNNFVAGMFNSLVYGGASRIGHLYTNSNGTSFKSDINNDLAMPQYKTAEDTTAEVATGIKTLENDTEVNYTDYVNDETLNVDFSEILNNTDVNYDVDLAISNILKGRATEVDFEHFKPGNAANRKAFYETTGIKLPEDSRLSNYILTALNNKEKRIYDIYLKHNANDLKQPDSLTQNDEGGIINEMEYGIPYYKYKVDNPDSNIEFYNADKVIKELRASGQIRAMGVVTSAPRDRLIIQPNTHALERMQERNITIEKAQSFIDEADFALKQRNGTQYVYYTNEGFAVLDNNGVLQSVGLLDEGGKKLYNEVMSNVKSGK